MQTRGSSNFRKYLFGFFPGDAKPWRYSKVKKRVMGNYKCVRSNTIHYSPKLEMTQMSRRMDAFYTFKQWAIIQGQKWKKITVTEQICWLKGSIYKDMFARWCRTWVKFEIVVPISYFWICWWLWQWMILFQRLPLLIYSYFENTASLGNFFPLLHSTENSYYK